MLGLPPGMTYETYVALALNLDTIRWLRVDDLVQAVRIASGAPAPVEYLAAVLGDPKKAAAVRDEQALARMMRR